MKTRLMYIFTGMFLLWTTLFGCSGDKSADWIRDFNYSQNQVRSFSYGNSIPCPFIPVLINGQKVNIMFDTGNSQGLSLTTAVSDKINYEVTGTATARNADGTYRGDIQLINIKSVNVFGQEYSNVMSSVSDWKMFSSEKINGMIGLEYFRNKIVTLDYKNNKIAVTDKEIDYQKLNTEGSIILPLIKSGTANRSDLLYFQGEINGEKSIIYLDTGYSHSIINLGGSNNFKKDITAQVKLGNKNFEFKNLRSQEIKRGENFEYPVNLVIGSDILKSNNFVIIIDKIQSKLVLLQM